MRETRQDILSFADTFIRSKGFNAFSYADISGVMEKRNAAIHYHFPTKSDLGEAVIDADMEKFNFQKRVYRDLPGDKQLQGIVILFQEYCERGEICLNSALTPNYNTFTPPMQEKIREMYANTLDWISYSLERGRKEGNIHFSGSAEDRALLVVSALMSSLLLSRVLGGI